MVVLGLSLSLKIGCDGGRVWGFGGSERIGFGWEVEKWLWLQNSINTFDVAFSVKKLVGVGIGVGCNELNSLRFKVRKLFVQGPKWKWVNTLMG